MIKARQASMGFICLFIRQNTVERESDLGEELGWRKPFYYDGYYDGEERFTHGSRLRAFLVKASQWCVER